MKYVSSRFFHLVFTIFLFAFSQSVYGQVAETYSDAPLKYQPLTSAQCQSQAARLENPQVSQLALANKQNFYVLVSWLKAYEAPLVKANNMLFRSYLYADVATDAKVRKSAVNCQQIMLSAIDTYLAKTTATPEFENALAVANLIPQAKGANHNSSYQQAKKVILSYHQQGMVLANHAVSKYKQASKQSAMAFRQTASTKGDIRFSFSKACVDEINTAKVKGLKEIAPAPDGETQVTLARKYYFRLLKTLPSESCRAAVYRDFQRRHQQVNQDNLLSLITLKAQQAKAQGYNDWAQSRLRGTSFESSEQVLALLNLLHASNQATLSAENKAFYQAPWDLSYQSQRAKKNKETKDKSKQSKQSLKPEQVLAGLTDLLAQEFGLMVKPLAESGESKSASSKKGDSKAGNSKAGNSKAELWHESVKAYALYQMPANSSSSVSKSEKSEQLLGYFYLDLHSRKGKYSKNRHRAIQRGVKDLSGNWVQ